MKKRGEKRGSQKKSPGKLRSRKFFIDTIETYDVI
jgi:hypothetical protein